MTRASQLFTFFLAFAETSSLYLYKGLRQKRVQNFCGSARYYFSNSRAAKKTSCRLRLPSVPYLAGERKISDHSRYAAFIEYINLGSAEKNHFTTTQPPCLLFYRRIKVAHASFTPRCESHFFAALPETAGEAQILNNRPRQLALTRTHRRFLYILK